MRNRYPGTCYRCGNMSSFVESVRVVHKQLEEDARIERTLRRIKEKDEYRKELDSANYWR